MSEGLFSIFGDRFVTQAVQNVIRQPLSNNENIGKTVKSVSTGPVKPNEPVKKAGEIKKSFLSKKGTALRDIQTPQKPLTPRSKNIETSAKKMFCSPFIYSDENENNENIQKHLEEMEFTKHTYKCNNYHLDIMDFLFEEPKVLEHSSPPNTPTPKASNHILERNDSFDDDFFEDDLADNGYPALFEDDDLPELY
ncbi:uncharacterized protein LOC113234810 [Hyposmocoma kahamanoa]|uniref:uncharacterized protein LOC113234810 n=1 Tax=Hyposmocoma kahamanoa TaxID=1477025 RepID=UPI000E6D9DBC|nr:uncharacterized protein LOC113234810 [Hyposmocoma kahamanoa]